ncbi:hypothetical protein IWW57_001241 [Coemansia sp. S610]|nr:hypothetical protein IWW57_001241 [Coemansia sp. S610]
MSLKINGYGCPLIQLVRRNALTLQYLRLLCDYVIDAAGLIQNPDGSYVMYPHLLSVPERLFEKLRETIQVPI